MFPAPPIATMLGLRAVGGTSDLVDQRGGLATIYRQAPGPGFGCLFVYMRADLVKAYTDQRNLSLDQCIVGERTLHHRALQGRLPDSLSKLLQSGEHRFSAIRGLENLTPDENSK